jgi:hypothetical protein
MQQGLKLQQAIVEANKRAELEQEQRDRMRGKHETRNKKLPKINGSVEWHESGHGAGDFK